MYTLESVSHIPDPEMGDMDITPWEMEIGCRLQCELGVTIMQPLNMGKTGWQADSDTVLSMVPKLNVLHVLGRLNSNH